MHIQPSVWHMTVNGKSLPGFYSTLSSDSYLIFLTTKAVSESPRRHIYQSSALDYIKNNHFQIATQIPFRQTNNTPTESAFDRLVLTQQREWELLTEPVKTEAQWDSWHVENILISFSIYSP